MGMTIDPSAICTISYDGITAEQILVMIECETTFEKALAYFQNNRRLVSTGSIFLTSQNLRFEGRAILNLFETDMKP